MVKRRRPVPPTGVGGMGGGEGFLKDVNQTKIRILITTITAVIYVNSLWCDFVFGKLKENINPKPKHVNTGARLMPYLLPPSKLQGRLGIDKDGSSLFDDNPSKIYILH